MMPPKRLEPRKEYVMRIGERLKECLDLQKRSIEENTYGVMKNASYYDAGEILAEKILKETNLI